MKTRNLIALAVASTFGWSASVFAGSSHEVVTPLSVNESGEVLPQNPSHVGFSGQQYDMTALGVTSESGSGSIGGSFSDSHAFSSDSASFGDGVAAADSGIYSDYYLGSWTPVTVETWDVYLIDSDQHASSDDTFIMMPTHELALVPTSSDEMVYDVVLVPISYEDMSASYSFESDGALGE